MTQPIVAVDALGGDHAPDEIVAGAHAAARDGVRVLLVGPAELADPAGSLDHLLATQAVAMDEDPALGLRGKPDATIRVAARAVAEGRAQALVSAGSTGATLAAALLELGRVEGVRRPAVAARIPVAAGVVLLVDAGGSTDVEAAVLATYARLGVELAQRTGTPSPRVGLLNVGTEPGKGDRLHREAFDLLSERDDFAGNVEPDGVLAGQVDVLVSDGQTGNVFLKTLEAARPDARRDTAAPVLGVRGIVLVAHGAAKAADVRAAILLAARIAQKGAPL